MQDFLLTPLLREAITYKLAHQVNNLWPENKYALGPLDMFPASITDAADWRNLIFGGWWSWLEKWGKHPFGDILSICCRLVVTYHSLFPPHPLSGARVQP